MPELILKALECEFTHSASVDFTRLEVSVDGKELEPIKNTFNNRERKALNKQFQFNTNVKLTLITAGTIKLDSTLTITVETLPHQAEIGQPGFHRGKREFREAAARYTLWYEVVPHGMTAAEFHRNAFVSRISLRDTLGRTGRGALTEREYNHVLGETKYRCSEVISFKDIFTLHRPQDAEKSNTNSLREWIAHHCNIWGEESVVPIEQLPDAPLAATLADNPQWRPVKDERSRVLAGFVVSKGITNEDSPFTHMSRDFVFDVIPSPAFSYLLAYTANSKGVANPNFDSTPIPLSHNEWESGSMPEEWRPEVGEFVTIWGRHVFDLGHMPMKTEIHPPPYNCSGGYRGYIGWS